MFFADPGPCPVCGTAHTACKGAKDDSTGVGVTRGVIVRPFVARNAGHAAESAAAVPAAISNRAERHAAQPNGR